MKTPQSVLPYNDSVTGVGFVPNTHYFFTVGKDGLLKQWDADNYERIITLKGHINEVIIQKGFFIDQNLCTADCLYKTIFFMEKEITSKTRTFENRLR